MSFYDALEPGAHIDSYRIDVVVARSGMATFTAPPTCATIAPLP